MKSKNTVFPTLYKRTSTGAIQIWTMEVSGNQFRTISGQQDGQLVTSEWNLCMPKNEGKANETTGEAQALAEATSKFDKKLKTGYSLDPKKIDSCLSYISPMLAKNLKDRLDKIDWVKGVIVNLKYNGARCIATFDGEKVILTTRKGEIYISIPHINKDLLTFFTKFPNSVLDGELYNYELRGRLNELMSLVRKSKNVTEEELAQSEKAVEYHVYDGFSFTEDLGPEVAYSTRKTWIEANLPKFSKYYREVKCQTAHSMKEVDAIFGEYVKDGEEGVIVRVPDSPYEMKRSANLLKYKPLEDSEAVIINISEGSGNWAGTGKVITLEWQKKTFNATFKGTWEQAAEFLKNKKAWIGKTVKFQFNGLTGLGVPNYARMDINNCDARK